MKDLDKYVYLELIKNVKENIDICQVSSLFLKNKKIGGIYPDINGYFKINLRLYNIEYYSQIKYLRKPKYKHLYRAQCELINVLEKLGYKVLSKEEADKLRLLF